MALDEKYGTELKAATLILGNGSSISYSSKFAYSSLYDEAAFTDEEKQLFDKFDTNNFEYILRKLFQASEVNKVLELDQGKKVNSVYENIRLKLIETIRCIHPVMSDIDPATVHDKVFRIMMDYRYIIDLNYDFLLYWILSNNGFLSSFPIEENGARRNVFQGSPFQYFYDGFRKNCGTHLSFDYDFVEEEIRKEEKTGIFYPHGNLLFVRDKFAGETLKIKSDGDLFDVVDKDWEKGYTPLFISEGTANKKMNSIRSISYLNYVYNEILSNLTDFIVIYGWSMGDCDTHLIKKIFSNKKIKTVAVSIYNENRELQAIQEEKIAIENKIKHYNKEIAVEFWEC
ncbi:DUF4917 family protein [Megasphaera elsdenii]|uniref:DUF4917 family protein n=1 Tax=Megasphaera elsdenii TaxID=907 RepID=UPI0012FEC87D|nr:DUF4917 family protein [Megasphaera elsdenii]